MIDPKKIEEWKAAIQELLAVGRDGDYPTVVRLTGTLAKAAAPLLFERDELLAVLREVSDHFLDEHNESCPICHEGGGYAGEEHAPDCRLAHLLKG